MKSALIVALLLSLATTTAQAEWGDVTNAARDRASESAARERAGSHMDSVWGSGGRDYRGKCCGPTWQDQNFPTDLERRTWQTYIGPYTVTGIPDCATGCQKTFFDGRNDGGQSFGGWVADRISDAYTSISDAIGGATGWW